MRERLNRDRLEQHRAVAFERHEVDPLPAEDPGHRDLPDGATDALHAEGQGILEGDDAPGVRLDFSAVPGGIELEEVPGRRHEESAAAGELLKDKALPRPQTGAKPGECDVEVDARFGGHERVPLREPSDVPVKLERAHLTRKDTGEGDEAAPSDGREVLEREVFTREHPLPDVDRFLQKSRLRGWRSCLVARGRGEPRLELHVDGLPDELAWLAEDRLSFVHLADNLLERVADDLVGQHLRTPSPMHPSPSDRRHDGSGNGGGGPASMGPSPFPATIGRAATVPPRSLAITGRIGAFSTSRSAVSSRRSPPGHRPASRVRSGYVIERQGFFPPSRRVEARPPCRN